MKISQNGIDFIKSFESFRPETYICPRGYPTIGWGHRIQPGEKFPPRMSLQEALDLLKQDIEDSENAIYRGVKVVLTQGQFDALVSLIFNWGTGNFSRSEGLEKLNKGDYEGAFEEFQEVIYVNRKPSRGLKRRRLAEADFWHTKTTITVATTIETETTVVTNDSEIKTTTT